MTFGSNKESARMIPALNFDITLVTSKWCLSCQSKIYDPNGSSSKRDGSSGIKAVDYTDIHYKGTTYKDKVCLRLSEKCAESFEFFSVIESSNSQSQIQGVIGLTPDPRGERTCFGA